MSGFIRQGLVGKRATPNEREEERRVMGEVSEDGMAHAIGCYQGES